MLKFRYIDHIGKKFFAEYPQKRKDAILKMAGHLGKRYSELTAADFVEDNRCWVTEWPKTKYSTLREAKEVLASNPRFEGKAAYPCMECLFWHIGQPRKHTTGRYNNYEVPLIPRTDQYLKQLERYRISKKRENKAHNKMKKLRKKYV